MNHILRRARRLALAGALALTLIPAALAQTGTPRERLDALIERRDKAMSEFFAKFTDELTPEEQQALFEQRPGREFIPQFEALAVEAKGTDVAAAARLEELGMQLDFNDVGPSLTTIERLVGESIESKELKHLPLKMQWAVHVLGGDQKPLQVLGVLLERSPHEVVKAPALFSMAQLQMGTDAALARKSFERLIAEYGKVCHSGPKTFADSAEAYLFELDHLQIGKQAPDFEATDENGVKFKLSDYRGKVVVLDFWGMW